MTSPSTLDRTFEHHELGPLLRLHVLATRKFKTLIVKVCLRRLLDERRTAFSLLVNLWRRGTRTHATQRALTEHLEGLFGASLSTYIVKYGPAQVGVLYLRLVADLHLPVPVLVPGLRLLGEVLRTPEPEGGWTADKIALEKKSLHDAIEGLRANKAAYAEEKCIEAMYEKEPFGLYEYGTVEAIPSVTRETLQTLHGDVTRTAPIDIYVCGDVDPAHVRSLCAEHLHIPGRQPRDPGFPKPLPAPDTPPIEAFEAMDVKQGKLSLGYRLGCTARDDDWPAAVLLNGVLGAFPHSKLFKNVREKENLAYYCSSSTEKHQGLLQVQSGIAFENYALARRLIDQQIDAIRNGDVSDDEIDNTHKALALSFLQLDDDPVRRVAWAYSESLAGRDSTIARAMARIEATGKADVVRAAARLRAGASFFVRGTDAPSHHREETAS